MYLSFVLVGLGAAIATNSVWFVAATALLVVLLQAVVIRPEENYLSTRFGSEYASYMRSTRRWI